MFFPCPYLKAEVELTANRLEHIQESHPGTLPEYLSQLTETLADPDTIRRSDRDPQAILFSKWFTSIRNGRYIVVVVIRREPHNWIVTVYPARKLRGGIIEWTKE